MSGSIWVVYFGEYRLEAHFRGDELPTAEVQFMIMTRDGRVLQKAASIPVMSLFEIIDLINLAIEKYKLDIKKSITETIAELEKEKEHGTKEDQAKQDRDSASRSEFGGSR